jgi:serine protease AprX
MLTNKQSAVSKVSTSKSAAWGGALAIAVCSLLLSATVAHGVSSKLARELVGQQASDQAPVKVVIQFTAVPTQSHHQKIRGFGGALRRELRSVKGGAYTVPAWALPILAKDPAVAYISPDRPVAMTSTAALDYHNEAINTAVAAGLGYDGSGVGVAVIDSGIANHPDLQGTYGSRVVYSQNFVDSSTGDAYGHGTHVAGIIGGSGASSSGPGYSYNFRGIAPGVNLIDLRVLDQNGQGSDSQVIAAIEQAIQLKNTYNIRVISLSVGRPVYESYAQDPLCQAVEQAWQAGIVVVVAAGNQGRDNYAQTNGYGTITAPGNDPLVITVGAMKTQSTPDRSDDVIASYSSKGPSLIDHVVKPDLVAPGNLIVSLYRPGETLSQLEPDNAVPLSLYQMTASNNASSRYFILSGTSMATPMVSGAVALMLQQNPSLTPDQVKARLMKTAYKNLVPYSSATDPVTLQVYNSQADIFTVGAGYLDIQAALNNTDLAPATVGSAASPIASQDANGNVVLNTGSSVVWGNSVLWGNTTVWGNSVLWGTNTLGQSVLWGTSVCLGTSTTQGYSVLWGTSSSVAMSVMWGTSTGTSATSVAFKGE